MNGRSTRAWWAAVLGVTCVLVGSGVSDATDSSFRRFSNRSGMVYVPAGPFWMGADNRGADETPRRRVDVDAFHIDRYEVTQADYDLCVKVGVCQANKRFPGEGGPNQPVVGVSWVDAETYCRWSNKRLPTEAEWEKAARGEDGRLYPWGDSLSCTMSNYGNGHNNECPNNPGHSAPVGSYAEDVSPWGLYDMGGNVWEHVSDFYDSSYFKRAPRRNPGGPANGRHHVVKGGSWYTTSHNIASSARISRSQSRNQYDGFRCAKNGR